MLCLLSVLTGKLAGDWHLQLDLYRTAAALLHELNCLLEEQ